MCLQNTTFFVGRLQRHYNGSQTAAKRDSDRMNIPPAAISITALGLICWVYAYKVVRRLRTADPEHGYTAFLVVGGNLLVLASFFASLWMTFGMGAAVVISSFLFLHFAIAGLPMVIEYMEAHTNHRTRQRKIQADNSEIQRILEGDDA